MQSDRCGQLHITNLRWNSSLLCIVSWNCETVRWLRDFHPCLQTCLHCLNCLHHWHIQIRIALVVYKILSHLSSTQCSIQNLQACNPELLDHRSLHSSLSVCPSYPVTPPLLLKKHHEHHEPLKDWLSNSGLPLQEPWTVHTLQSATPTPNRKFQTSLKTMW